MARQGNKTLQIQILEENELLNKYGRVKVDFTRYISRSSLFILLRQTKYISAGSFAGTNKAVQEVAVGGRNAFNGFVSLYQPVMDLGLHRLTEASRINEKSRLKRPKI